MKARWTLREICCCFHSNNVGFVIFTRTPADAHRLAIRLGKAGLCRDQISIRGTLRDVEKRKPPMSFDEREKRE